MKALWSEELTGRLCALWAAPYKPSATDIASILTNEFGRDITRNATLGKAHRLGLEARDRVKVTHSNSRPRTRVRKPSVAAIKAELFVAQLAAVEPRHIEMVGLEHNECRYPYGDGPFTFCGCETAPKKPYCPAHVELCADHAVRRKPDAVKKSPRSFSFVRAFA
jgi:GcrA cell cycle regulator